MKYVSYRVSNNLPAGLQNWSELWIDHHNPKRGSMNIQEQMEERLWDFIDGLSSPTERSAIEELITANLEWQRKYKELLDVHQLMNSTELDAPSMRFTKNVMEEIAHYQVAPAAKTYINKNIIRSIGAFFVTLITGFLVYCLGQFKWSGNNTSEVLPQYNLDLHVEKYNPAKYVNSTYTNIFVLVIVILGLVLLDMYLQQKRQQTSFHKEA